MMLIIIILVILFTVICIHYNIPRYIKINLNPLSSMESYINIPKVKVNTPVIVCFTTTPKRINRCKYTIESILSQSVRVDEIRIHIPMNIKYKIPQWLKLLEKRLSVFKIIRCKKDYGPLTKLLPILYDKKLPINSRIIYIDDDMIYNKNMVKNLISYSIMKPNNVICNKGWNVDDYPEKSYKLIFNMFKGFICNTPKFVDVVQGFSGVLVRPFFFNLDQISDTSKFPPESYYVDDVYISGILNMRDINRVSTGIPSCIPYIREILNETIFTPTSLATIHNKNKKNDCIVANFFKWKKQVSL